MANLANLPTLISSQNWPAAIKLLRREASKPDAGADIFYNLGKVLEADGKWLQSGEWFQKAVDRRSGYQVAWFELGRWAVDQRDLRRAFDAFMKAVDLEPADADARRNAGRIALRLGRWAQARTLWEAFSDNEAKQAQYRITAELSEPTSDMRNKLLDDRHLRPEVLKTLTRTAKGSIPLKIY